MKEEGTQEGLVKLNVNRQPIIYGMYLTKTPTLLKKYYSKLLWEIPNQEKKIYLSFDDGPTPEVTNWVLEVLQQFNVKATFFCIGENVEKHPVIYQNILDEGHAVGNHTFNHLNGWKTNTKAYVENIKVCEKTVNSKLFRPPYGKIKKQQLKQLFLTHKIVMWDVLSGDFDQKISPQKCYENVINNVKPGSIIVFHDSFKAAKNLKYALPKAIAFLIEKGFVFELIKH